MAKLRLIDGDDVSEWYPSDLKPQTFTQPLLVTSSAMVARSISNVPPQSHALREHLPSDINTEAGWWDDTVPTVLAKICTFSSLRLPSHELVLRASFFSFTLHLLDPQRCDKSEAQLECCHLFTPLHERSTNQLRIAIRLHCAASLLLPNVAR